MSAILHITSGDCAGDLLAKSGIVGEVLVWHDILYDGPRQPGWPDEAGLRTRALFLEQFTGGGLKREAILSTLREQYARLAAAVDAERIVLWFDACLFDQSMLAHILACLPPRAALKSELLCVDSFPGIERFNGLGQLTPHQLSSLYARRTPVSESQLQLAVQVDRAFALRDLTTLRMLAACENLPLPWIPAAAARWLAELPDNKTGLGRLETLTLQAIGHGYTTPSEIYAAVAAADTPPQFWGDTTLWARINGLADRQPPYLLITGPTPRLPLWSGQVELQEFRITALPRHG